MTLPKTTTKSNNSTTIRKPYEVTVNLEFPTTETLDIPKEWIESKCVKCNMPILIDEENNNIHHRQPFCNWWMNIWHNKCQMTIEVNKLHGIGESVHNKANRIKNLLEKQKR